MKRLTTDNTTAIRVWDTRYEFWIEIRLEKAIEVARDAYLKLKVSSQ
jgi:hypothetical protein